MTTLAREREGKSAVRRALERGFAQAAQRGPVALVVTVSNACPALKL